MARRRFDSWHSANRYPWESYEEAKKRYENQYGSIQEDEVDTSWAEEYKREQGLAQEEEEDEGFISSALDASGLSEFGSGAAKSWDEFQAGLATKGEHIVAPWLDKLGSLREGEQRAEKYADAIREWAPEYRKKQLEEAAQYPEIKTRLQKRQEEDPTYKPAETRAETLARLKEEGGWKYKLAKKLPEFVPLSTEKFEEDIPTAGEMGSYSTSTVIPMAAGGAAALGAYATGLGPVATAGLAMLSGGTAASSMVAAQTADEVKDHPIIRRALEIDPDIPFEKLSPIQQSRINEIASHAAQNNLGMRLISSGIPEMIGYIPAGGWLVRGLADVVGGTTSEVWDIAVSRDSMLDALIDGGVDPNKVAQLEQAFIEIGPKKSEVFVKALAGEFVATAGFTSIEQTVKNALPKRDHRVDPNKTDSKLAKENKENQEKKIIELRRKEVETQRNKRRVTNELVRSIVALHEVDPEAAVQEFQDLKLAEGRIQNDVASVLAEDNADIFRDISHRIGEGKRREAIDKALDKWEKETARIEEKAQKQAERERIQAEKREAKRVADAQKQDVAEDTEAEKEAQATTQTILDEAEATETVVDTEEETAPKKKAAKKKTTKKTAKDLKAEEDRRQEAAGKKMTIEEEVVALLKSVEEGGVPLSTNRNIKRIAKAVGVEVTKKDKPIDVINKIKAKAMEADAVVEEEVKPEAEEEVTPEKEIITVYDPLGKPYEVEVTKRSPKTGYPKIIHPDTGKEVLVDGQNYALENPASPDFVLETEGDTPTVSSLNNKKINELIKKYEKQLKAPKKKGERKNVGILLRNVNALKMERNRRAEAKAEPKVPVTKAPKLNKKLSDRYSKVVDETPSKVLRNPDNTLKEATIGDQKFTGEELKLLGAVKNVGGTETYTANPEFKTEAEAPKPKATTTTPPKTKATKKGKEKVTTKPKTDADRANEFVQSELKKWDKKNKLKKDASKLDIMKHKEKREAKVQELTTEAVGKIKPKEVDPAEEAFVQRRVDEARAERAKGRAGSTRVDAVIASKEDYSGEDTEKIKKVQVEKGTPDLSVREINIIEQKARAEYQKQGDKRNIKDAKGNTKKITQKNNKGNKSLVLNEEEVKYTLSRDEIDTVIDDFKNKTNLKDKDVTFRVLDRNNKEDVNHLTDMVGEAETNEIFKNAEAFVPKTGDVIYIIDGNIKGYKKFLERMFKGGTSGVGRLINVLFHEVIGHYGLRKFLGDGYNDFINRFVKLNKKVLKDYAVEGTGQEYLPPEIKNIADLDERTEAYDNYDSAKKKDLDFLMAEEYIASHFAEFGARDPNIINRIVVALRNKLSEIPLFSGVTTNQVKTLLAEIQQDYIGGRRNFLLGEDFAPVRFAGYTAQREKQEEKVEEAKKPEAKGEAEEEIETLTISQSKLVNDYSLNFSKKTSLENIPKKTIKKVYKLMDIRDGKLYYPFVEAKGKEKLKRKPQYPVKLGEWLSASFVLPKDMPGQGRGMDLAPRGGFHLTENLTPHLKTKLKDGTTRVWVEVEIGDDINYQDRVGEKGKNTEFLIKRDKDGNVIDGKVPEGGQYRFKRPAIQGGWWRIAGEMKLLRVLPESESNALLNEYVASKEYTDAVDKKKKVKPMTVSDVNKSIKLYHGSPKRFNKFITDRVGTGAHGWGLYFSDYKPIAEIYSRNPKGYLYNVDLTPKKEEFMDLDRSYEDQSEYVKTILGDILKNEERKISPSQLNWQTGDHVYNWAQYKKGSQKGASEYLSNRGIKGMRTAPSKFTNLGTKIYVVYNADDLLIESVTDEKTGKVETAEGKLLTKINQSKAFGIYARYNKDAGVDGTMLLHRNTRPDEGEYRITFFKADGELDMARTENGMGHEHFPTLDKAKDRLKEVGEGQQDISGGRKVNMSKRTFADELARAEGKAVEVKPKPKTMKDRVTFSKEYLEKKSGEGHGAPIGTINLSKMVPPQLKKYEGESGVAIVFDRLKRGKYSPLWGEKSEHSKNIYLGGGVYYSFDPNNKSEKGQAVVASEEGNNTATKGFLEDIGGRLGFIVLAKWDNHKGNMDVWETMWNETLDAIRLGNFYTNEKVDKDVLNNLVMDYKNTKFMQKKVNKNLLNQITGYESLIRIGADLTYDVRGQILTSIFGKNNVKRNNLYNLEDILRRTSDYPDADLGDLAAVVEFDVDNPNFQTDHKFLGVKKHKSYPNILQGKGIVRFKTPIKLGKWGTDWLTKASKTGQVPYLKVGETEIKGGSIRTPEMKSYISGKPIDAVGHPRFGEIITKRPDKAYTIKTAGQNVSRAVRSMKMSGGKFKVTPEMIIEPIAKTKEARKQAYNASRMMSYNQATVAEGRLNYDGGHWIPTFKWQDKLSHKLTRRLISQGTLTDANVYKDIRRRNKGVIMMAEQAGEKLFNLLRKSKQQKVLFEYFTTPDADANLITNSVERKAAIAAKKQIKQIGRDLVTKGLMTQESLERFDDQYLPRKYLKYLLGDSDFNAISKGGAGVKLDLGYTKKRGDIPAGIAELIYGEIKDPAYLASISISTPVRDMAILDMFEVIATEGLKENRGWVLPKTLVKFDTIGEMKKLAGTDQALIDALQLMDTGGVKISGHWLLNEAERIQDLVDNHLTLDDKKEKLARALIKSMTNKGKEIVGQVLPKDYRRVPKGRKYGYLSGMAIRKEIFEDLFGWGAKGNTFDINADGTVDQSWAERILGTGGTFETYNRIWKWSKVSANPPSWVRNFISNMIFMSLGPVPIPRLPDLFIRSIADQIKTRTVQARGTQREFDELNTHTKLADKMGLTSGGFSQTELKLIRNDFIRSKNNEKGVLGILKIRDAFKRVGGGIQRSTSDLYGGIDTLGKVMMLKYLKGQGMSDSNAAMQAEKWLFDYSNPLPSVKYLRKSAFGAPFLSYPSFVAPLLIETVIKRPWKFAPYFILAEYLKSTFKEEQDVDDEEYRATMGELSEYLRDKANLTGNLSWIPESVLPLPNLDKQGRGQVIDVGYLFPWGMFAEVFRELDPTKDEGSQITDAFHTVGLLSSPLVNLSTTALTHRDPFTDRQIYDEFATSGEKYASWINYGFNLTMPPMFHGLSPVGGANYGWWKNTGAGGFGALTRLYESYSGKVGREGEPKFTPAQAIARMFGMNVTPIAPFEARAKNVYFEVQKIKKLQRQIAYKYRKGMEARYTKEELKDLLTGEIEKLNNLVKKLNERVGKRLPQSLKRSEKERLRAMEEQLKYMRSLKKAG